MTRDAVCGMQINENDAAGKSEYKGKTYHFCSPGCKAAFDKEPEKYALGDIPGAEPRHH